MSNRNNEMKRDHANARPPLPDDKNKPIQLLVTAYVIKDIYLQEEW